MILVAYVVEGLFARRDVAELIARQLLQKGRIVGLFQCRGERIVLLLGRGELTFQARQLSFCLLDLPS